MQLIIFDIDGTLTHTNEIDSVCFTQAISEQLNIHDLNANWHEYKYSTDSGLLSEIYDTHLNRAPTEEEIKIIQNRFVELLTFEFHNHKKGISIAGAADIIRQIQTSSKYRAAIATGGWSMSANLKLDHATIPHQDLPKAYSDQFFNRTDIILHAIEKAKPIYQVDFH